MIDKLPSHKSLDRADRCHVCAAPTTSTTHAGAPFIECPKCGFAALACSAGREDYWSESHYREAAGVDFWIPAKKRYFGAALALLEGETIGRRLLDVGGGIGFFAQMALSRDWDAYSFDVSPKATELAARRLGSDRALSDIDALHPASFDVVCLWCVLAHTREPADLVASVSRLLRPNGVLWITTPNFDFQKPYGALRAACRRPIDFDRDDHVSHFTPRALTILLRTNGFSNLSFHLCGTLDVCFLTSSQTRLLTLGKRAFNQFAFRLARLGARNYVSELQVTTHLYRE